jgi:hypothetical protein
VDKNIYAIAIPACVTVLVALAGYLITYNNNIRMAQRQARLDRINRQLSELYGPLFSVTHTGARVFGEFLHKYAPHGSMFIDGVTPGDEQLKVWRLWMTTVFMPQNRHVYDLVVAKADLLIEEKMPECLLDLCAHVAAYETVKKRWEEDDFSEYTSLINYPTGPLLKYSSDSFRTLKRQQALLLAERRSKD